MNNRSKITIHNALAVRLVNHLAKIGKLDDIIIESDAQFVRRCKHCNMLINEGYMLYDFETFCSDECLMALHPDINPNELDFDNVDWIYWTAWEG